MRLAGIPKASGVLPRRIFVFLWIFHKLIITEFGKGYLHYIPPFCASSDCREDCHWSTTFPVLPDMIIILQTEPFDTIRHFQSGNTEHLAASSSCIVYKSTSACEIDVKTSSRERGQVHLYATRARSSIHYPAPTPATKCPLFHKLKAGHPTLAV